MVARSVTNTVVAMVLAVGLASLPAQARAQDPVPAEAPPPPPPAAPVPAAASGETPPLPTGPALTDDEEYASFVAAMPQDYDINYAFTAPAGSKGRSPVIDKGGGPSKANTRALGISGGVFLTLGSVLGISAIGMGAASAGDGRDADALVVPAIATGVSGGTLLILGASLLGAKRAARRKNGELPEKPAMTESQRKSAVLLGSLSAGIGLGGVVGGALLLAKDSESKGGATLVAFGVIFTGLALWPIGRLLADRARRNRMSTTTARFAPTPLMVRHGGGLGLTGSF